MRRLLLLIGLFMLTACDSEKEIVTRLGETEANEIMVFLASRGIPAQKSGQSTAGAGGTTVMEYTIMVPESHYIESMAILTANGMPRSKTQSLLELFPGGGMMTDAQEKQIRYQAGLAETLAGMIRKIDGVLDAAVVLSLPPAETVTGTAAPRPSASVYVKHQGVLDDPNNQLTSKIKRLLSGAIPGLTVDDVVVVLDRSRVAELTMPASIEPYNAPEEWRSVFGVVVAKDSVGALQRLLGLLFAILILALSAFGWMFWKSSVILQKGGFKALWRLRPFEPKPEPTPEEKPFEGAPS
jgi:type III secretion protein J